jgi:hypothetical protein
MDALFELSSKERSDRKYNLELKMIELNDIFNSKKNIYHKSGYYDQAIRNELDKFNLLFVHIRRFLINLGSTHAENYYYAFLKKEYEDYDKNPNIDFGEEISLKNIDIKKLSEHLGHYFKDSSELYSVLIGNVPAKPLEFVGYQTELLYVFNRLKLNGKIYEERREICEWLKRHFRFYDKKLQETVEAKFNSLYKQYKSDIDKIPKAYDEIQQISKFYT